MKSFDTNLLRSPLAAKASPGAWRPRLLSAGVMLAMAGALFAMPRAFSGEGRAVPPLAGAAPVTSTAPASEVAVFAGGCFWGVQGVFQHVQGVHNAVSGYAGGEQKTASYATVSTGTTGHAEAVQVTFDPHQVSYARLLQIYFSVAHDPTELDMQGPDHGTQYRSAVFPANEEQARTAKAYIAQLDGAHVFQKPIVTRIEPGKSFYPAEAYHQDFLAHNPHYPYIAMNDLPKVDDLKRLYPEAYRADPVLVAEAAASH